MLQDGSECYMEMNVGRRGRGLF